MNIARILRHAAAGALLALAALAPAAAQQYPAPKQGAWVAKDVKFHTGEVLPEVRLAYTTVGEPSGEPVVLLHGTGGTAAGFLNAAFAGELFGPGQPLDASKYYIIMPDSVGHGRSTKPSDGLKARFPKYDSEDMVDLQYRLLKEGLGISRVRLVIGNSMGGMHTFVWASRYPDYMDALVPMATQPTPMASRNWMLRRLKIEMIRQDPSYMGGEYTE
jgi:homoserine O-acetyltransferase